MATKKKQTKKKAASRRPKKAASRKKPVGKKKLKVVRKAPVREPRSGTLDSTLDPRSTSFPEYEPPTDNPEASPAAGGAQSGDLEGLETDEDEAYESVAELADEGQDLEAEEVEAIERAPDPDQGELKPRKVRNTDEPGDFKDRNRL